MSRAWEDWHRKDWGPSSTLAPLGDSAAGAASGAGGAGSKAWHLKSDDRLFPSAALFKDFLNLGLEDLLLGNFGLGRSSFRPGGATHFFLAGKGVDWLRFRGRWKNLATLESYIQEGSVHLVSANILPQAARLLQNRFDAFPTEPAPPTARNDG